MPLGCATNKPKSVRKYASALTGERMVTLDRVVAILVVYGARRRRRCPVVGGRRAAAGAALDGPALWAARCPVLCRFDKLPRGAQLL